MVPHVRINRHNKKSVAISQVFLSTRILTFTFIPSADLLNVTWHLGLDQA